MIRRKIIQAIKWWREADSFDRRVSVLIVVIALVTVGGMAWAATMPLRPEVTRCVGPRVEDGTTVCASLEERTCVRKGREWVCSEWRGQE